MNNTKNTRVKFGKHSYSRENIEVLSWGEKADLSVGAFTSIAKGCRCILGGNHRINWGTTYPFGLINGHIFNNSIIEKEKYSQTNGSINIGSDVWIGLNVTIMSGVSIGNGAIVAANSHVVRDIEEYAIYGGNPSKKIRYRFDQDIREELKRIAWWKYDDNMINKIIPLLQREISLAALKEIKRCLMEVDYNV